VALFLPLMGGSLLVAVAFDRLVLQRLPWFRSRTPAAAEES